MTKGAHLEVWLGPPQPATTTIELRESQTIVVGRAAASALVLKDGRASGRHLTLEVSKQQVSVVDHSTNGSYLNGRALEKGKMTVLSEGDVRALPTVRHMPRLGPQTCSFTCYPLQVISPVIAIKSAPTHNCPVPRSDYIAALVYRASASAPPEASAGAPPRAPPVSRSSDREPPSAAQPSAAAAAACRTPKPPKGVDFELDDDFDAPLSSEATRRGSHGASGSSGGASKRVSTRERLASAKRKRNSGAGGLASSDAITTTTLDGDVYQHLVETTEEGM